MKPRYYYLIYVSQAVNSMSDQDNFALVEQSYNKNNRHDITGILLYHVTDIVDNKPGRYMQLLEGCEHDVKALYSKIKQDARHHRVTLINEGYLSRKHFKDWSMAFKKVHDQNNVHPGFINMEDVFEEKLTSSKFNIALMFLRTFYGLQSTQIQSVF